MKTTEDTESTEWEFDLLTSTVIGCAIEFHRELGPGLLESAYERCLAHELKLTGIEFQRQVPVSISYKGIHLDCGYRADFLVAHRVLLELKAVDRVSPIHQAQILTYMKLTEISVGLIINFNVPKFAKGVRRFAI